MSESSAKNVIPLPPAPNRRDKRELAFLPAALEIVETPPSQNQKFKLSEHWRVGGKKIKQDFLGCGGQKKYNKIFVYFLCKMS